MLTNNLWCYAWVERSFNSGADRHSSRFITSLPITMLQAFGGLGVGGKEKFKVILFTAGEIYSTY